MTIIENLGGRKFLSTLAFAAVVVLNTVFNWGLTVETLALIGGAVGVYNVANVTQKAVTAKTQVDEAIDAIEDVFEDDGTVAE